MPAASSFALLENPGNPAADANAREAQIASRVLGVRVLVLNTSSLSEIDGAFAALVERRPGALLVGADPIFLTWRDRFLALAARYALPAIFANREFVEAGGLMSYGPNVFDAFRLVGNYTGRILKGERPADLPVQQATKIELD
jgi:putative tryptophan/tyrosine transport system substrate-binding protein